MIERDELIPLLNHIKRFVELAPAEEDVIAKHIQSKEVKNKEYILRSGQVCKANHFVVKGCLRLFSQTDDGTEQILQFGIDDWWIVDYTSFDRQEPSLFSIQALEDGQLFVLDRKTQEILFHEVPKLERYFRLVLQRAYAATLMRVHFIYSQSGEERYRQFNSSFPGFVQRIPQYMLASYLGFTPEFLSKIRGKKDRS